MTVDPSTPDTDPEEIGEKSSVPVNIEERTQSKDVEVSDEGETMAQPKMPPATTETKGETEYPTGLKLILIVISIYLAAFLVALDRTIIANAIPVITSEFHSLDDIGWYGSAFLIAGCSVMLLFGKIYTFYSIKWVFLITIGIFEIGSAICGAANSSTTFIIGRAIAGLGSAGVFSGGVLIIVHSVPLAKRPLFQGMFGAVFGVASVIGPLLGGALTKDVSWRWCFYINLPIGGATILALIFILHPPPNLNQAAPLTLRQQFLKLDPLGTSVFLPGCICLLLALQWGGSKCAWSSPRIIVLLVLSVVLLATFVLLQVVQREAVATVPPRLLKQRSVAAAFSYVICSGAAMLVLVYYLPLYFQAIKGVNAVESGIRLLPLILSIVLGSMSAGLITFKSGYYAPSMIASPCFSSIGAGLISTWRVDTPIGKWIGYQILFGFGLGLGMQQPNMAVQTILSKKDIPTATALMFFGQTLGGAVFLAIAQSIFNNQLKSNLLDVASKSLGATERMGFVTMVLNTGATEIRQRVPSTLLGAVLVAFNRAITRAVYVSVGVTCASLVGALAIEWKSVKKGEGQGGKKKGKGGDAIEEIGKEEEKTQKTV